MLKNTRNVVVALGLGVSVLFAGVTFAQTTNTTSPVVTPAKEYNYTLKVGSKDATTGKEVSKLQKYLIANKVLTGAPTGSFGPMTAAAVGKLKDQYKIAYTAADKATFTNDTFIQIENAKTAVLVQKVFPTHLNYEESRQWLEKEIKIEFDDYLFGETDLTEGYYYKGKGGLFETVFSVWYEVEDGGYSYDTVVESIAVEIGENKFDIYTLLTEYDKEHPLYTRSELSRMKKMLNKWFKTPYNDELEDEVVLDDFFSASDKTIELNKKYNYFTIDKESRVRDKDTSDRLKYDAYKYKIRIDLQKLKFALESELDMSEYDYIFKFYQIGTFDELFTKLEVVDAYLYVNANDEYIDTIINLKADISSFSLEVDGDAPHTLYYKFDSEVRREDAPYAEIVPPKKFQTLR